MKGDPETGYTDYATATFSGSAAPMGSMSYDGKYIIIAGWGSSMIMKYLNTMNLPEHIRNYQRRIKVR